MSKFICFFILILWAFKPFAQDLKKISEDFSVEKSYEVLISQYKSNAMIVEDVFADSTTIINFNVDLFCTNGICLNITSPIYFLKIKGELNFSFRLENSYICILYLIDDVVQTIELFEPKNKIYIQYVNIQEQ